jgi:DUF971 family protein
MPTPTEIRLKRADKRLEVDFDDDNHVAFSAEFLRVESPSAEVQGHGPNQRRTVPGKRHVGILGVEAVGHYAIRILFDDGHDTGIFSWDYLHMLGREQQDRWYAYLAALAKQGLGRDP